MAHRQISDRLDMAQLKSAIARAPNPAEDESHILTVESSNRRSESSLPLKADDHQLVELMHWWGRDSIALQALPTPAFDGDATLVRRRVLRDVDHRDPFALGFRLRLT